VRLRTGENLGPQPLDQFIAWLTPIVATRSLSLTEARM
jgi:hypothetical protein